MNTEINLIEPFGSAIYETILEYNLKQNLEIGSWDGGGSTFCFVEAMKRLNGDLFLGCIEIFEEKIKTLSNRYKNIDFVHPIYGSSISYDQLKYKDFNLIWNSEYNKIPKQIYTESMVRNWFDRAVELLKTVKKSALDYFKDKTWDSVLIDGGEFTGYSEYLLVKDKTKILFLDDVHNAFKCYQIYCELKNNSSWTLLRENNNVRNGFAIFKKK